MLLSVLVGCLCLSAVFKPMTRVRGFGANTFAVVPLTLSRSPLSAEVPAIGLGRLGPSEWTRWVDDDGWGAVGDDGWGAVNSTTCSFKVAFCTFEWISDRPAIQRRKSGDWRRKSDFPSLSNWWRLVPCRMLIGLYIRNSSLSKTSGPLRSSSPASSTLD